MERIKTAGGLVFYKKNFLLIFKRGKWDLPKGKYKHGDTDQKTAKTEVFEETALPIKDLEIIKRLIPTYYIKTFGEKNFQKRTTWFLMNYQGDPNIKLIPEQKEGITECRWVHKKDLKIILPKAHLRIIYLFDYLKQLPLYNNYFK